MYGRIITILSLLYCCYSYYSYYYLDYCYYYCHFCHNPVILRSLIIVMIVILLSLLFDTFLNHHPRQVFMHPTGALCPCSTSWSCFSLAAVIFWWVGWATERLVKIWWGCWKTWNNVLEYAQGLLKRNTVLRRFSFVWTMRGLPEKTETNLGTYGLGWFWAHSHMKNSQFHW